MSRAARLMARTVPGPEGCTLWAGPIDKETGYGRAYDNGKTRNAHKVSYEVHIGPVPEGLWIDHTCRVRHCINPAHLEAVPPGENSARGTRGWRMTGKCRRGRHDVTDAKNVQVRPNGDRECRACATEAARARRASARAHP